MLALALYQPSAEAKWHRINLPDGVEVTFDVQRDRVIITMSGHSKSSYCIEASEDLDKWSVLRNRIKIENGGTFTYIDDRILDKCFYRIGMLEEPGSSENAAGGQ
jgi:hypothetical protein